MCNRVCRVRTPIDYQVKMIVQSQLTGTQTKEKSQYRQIKKYYLSSGIDFFWFALKLHSEGCQLTEFSVNGCSDVACLTCQRL